MRKFKNKITGDVVTERHNLDNRFYTNDVHSIPALFVENSSDWIEIKEEIYPRILEFYSKELETTYERKGEYFFEKNKATGSITEHFLLQPFYSIHKVAKNSKETFQIGDKTNKGIIERFKIANNNSIWVEFKDNDICVHIDCLEHYKEVFPRIYSFRHKFGARDIYTITDSGIYTNYKESFGYNYILEESFYTIFQIQTSETEILTVGDYVKFQGTGCSDIGIINKFELRGSGLYACSATCEFHVKHVKKIEKLFTTENGVDIFENDDYWFITAQFIIVNNIKGKLYTYVEERPRFGSIENAKSWVDQNEKKFSKKDISNILNDLDNRYLLDSQFIKQLKQKLGI